MAGQQIRFPWDAYRASDLDKWRILKTFYDLLSAGGWVLQTPAPNFSLSAWDENNPPEIIFGMGDALQAAYPVYLKIEVGNATGGGGYNAGSRILYIYVGATPGGCELLSARSADGNWPSLTVRAYSTYGNGTSYWDGLYRTSHFGDPMPDLCIGGCAGDGYFQMYEFPYMASTEYSLFGLERTRDPAGNVTGDGVVITSVGSNVGYLHFRIPTLFAKPEYTDDTSGGLDTSGKFSFFGSGGAGGGFTNGLGLNSYLDSAAYPMEHYENKVWFAHVFASRNKQGAGYPSAMSLVPKRNYTNVPIPLYHTFVVNLWGEPCKFLYTPIGNESFYYANMAVRVS